MKIKELIRILNEAHDKNKEIYIPTIDDNGNLLSTNKVGGNFDDNGDYELYETA